MLARAKRTALAHFPCSLMPHVERVRPESSYLAATPSGHAVTIAFRRDAGPSLLTVGRDRGARRVWERRCLSCIGDSGPRPAAGCAPEHLGEPAFRQRVAGLDAELVRGYRRVIDSAVLKHLIVTLPAGGRRRLPGGLTCGPPRQV